MNPQLQAGFQGCPICRRFMDPNPPGFVEGGRLESTVHQSNVAHVTKEMAEVIWSCPSCLSTWKPWAVVTEEQEGNPEELKK